MLNTISSSRIQTMACCLSDEMIALTTIKEFCMLYLVTPPSPGLTCHSSPGLTLSLISCKSLSLIPRLYIHSSPGLTFSPLPRPHLVNSPYVSRVEPSFIINGLQGLPFTIQVPHEDMAPTEEDLGYKVTCMIIWYHMCDHMVSHV